MGDFTFAVFYMFPQPMLQRASCNTMQMDAPKMETLLTVGDVAKLLRLSPRKFEDMIKTGLAPAFVRMGRLRRWEPEVVKAWLKENRSKNSTPDCLTDGIPGTD